MPERNLEMTARIESAPVIGNHDLDDPSGPEAWAEIHGPRNFDFAYGHTRFIALDAAPGRVGELAVEEPAGSPGRARRRWPSWPSGWRRPRSRTRSC